MPEKRPFLEISYFGKFSKFLHPNLILLDFSEFVAKITCACKILWNDYRTLMSLRKRCPKIDPFWENSVYKQIFTCRFRKIQKKRKNSRLMELKSATATFLETISLKNNHFCFSYILVFNLTERQIKYK